MTKYPMIAGMLIAGLSAPLVHAHVNVNEEPAPLRVELSAASTDYRQLAAIALAKLDNIKSEDWSFTQTMSSGESTSVEVFDPRKASQQWQLISKNGKTPSQKQLLKFNKRMNSDKEEDDEDTHEVDLTDMIDRDTLLFVAQNGNIAQYSFTPVIEDLADEKDKLNGLLFIDQTQQLITRMEVTNNDELSPAFSVTLDEFKLDFKFTVIDQRPVIAKIHTQIHGTVGFFKSLDQESLQEFSDYIYVGG